MTSAFGGALLFTLVAVLVNLHQAGVRWIAVALGLYLVAVAVTVAVNVPLNDAIKAAGNPEAIRDLAVVRDRFHDTLGRVEPRTRGLLDRRIRFSRLGSRPLRALNRLTRCRRGWWRGDHPAAFAAGATGLAPSCAAG